MKSSHSLLILDPAIRTPADAARARLERLAGEHTLHVIRPALGEVSQLTALDPAQFSGILIFGSAASVNDDAEWLHQLRAWLRPVVTAGQVPVLGICFGHQLLAHVLGGTVARLYPQAVKGIRTLTVTTAHVPWWPVAHPETVCLFHSHGEAVVQLPPAARVLAQSRILLPSGEAFQLVEMLGYDGLPVWSFQTHPETTEAFLHEQGCAALVGTPEAERCFEHGWAIVTAFLQFCQAPETHSPGALAL